MPVKCQDCGYLAKHVLSSRAGSSRYHEVDIAERDNPHAFFNHVVEGFVGDLPSELVCFLQKADLVAEYYAGANNDWVRDANAIGAIIKERECDGFLPHKRGFGPKEHWQAYEMQRLETERRALDIKLSEMEQRAQENNAKIAEQSRAIAEQTQIIAKESKEILRDSKEISMDSKAMVQQIKMIAIDNDRFSKRVTFWVILLAAAQVLVGLIAYFFQRESYWDQLLRKLFEP